MTLKPGDVITIDGTQMTVTRIHPTTDGTVAVSTDRSGVLVLTPEAVRRALSK